MEGRVNEVLNFNIDYNILYRDRRNKFRNDESYLSLNHFYCIFEQVHYNNNIRIIHKMDLIFWVVHKLALLGRVNGHQSVFSLQTLFNLLCVIYFLLSYIILQFLNFTNRNFEACPDFQEVKFIFHLLNISLDHRFLYQVRLLTFSFIFYLSCSHHSLNRFRYWEIF